MANLVLLCRRHHHALHDDELRIVPLGKGRFRFDRADDKELPRYIDPWALVRTDVPIGDEHPDVSATAATTSWTAADSITATPSPLSRNCFNTPRKRSGSRSVLSTKRKTQSMRSSA